MGESIGRELYKATKGAIKVMATYFNLSFPIFTYNSVLVFYFVPQTCWFLYDHLSECCQVGGKVPQRDEQSKHLS